MNNPEKGLFNFPPCILKTYDKYVKNGFLRESLLNVSSYRPRFNEGTGSLTVRDAKWATIAVISASAFGVAAAQFLGRIP